MQKIKQKNKIVVWLQAIRVFSLTASVVPVLIGAAIAFAGKEAVSWELFPLVLFCSVMFQIGTNMVNDYYDFKKGIDTAESYGSSRCLVDGLLNPGQMLIAGLVAFALGILGGFVLIYFRGYPILLLGVIGFVGGLCYTAMPISYKYFALGDAAVFILMGPLMVIGSYFCLTGKYDNSVLFISIPVGFLVAAILQANNTRDINHDRQAGVKTIASLLGLNKAKFSYISLLVGAYLVLTATVLLGVLNWWALIVFASLPLAAKNIKTIYSCSDSRIESIATLDVMTAKLHLAFGVLLMAGILLGKFF